MNPTTWNELKQAAGYLGYKLCNYDKDYILEDSVCFHLIVQGNFKGALKRWFSDRIDPNPRPDNQPWI
jgi:hypothetical protein